MSVVDRNVVMRRMVMKVRVFWDMMMCRRGVVSEDRHVRFIGYCM
jgi:hypothetical protein